MFIDFHIANKCGIINTRYIADIKLRKRHTDGCFVVQMRTLCNKEERIVNFESKTKEMALIIYDALSAALGGESTEISDETWIRSRG